ncbi:hypothetical protein [Streptomyces sp. NPDC014733]|uniref:hypothetical protein n=1 Tax=Streptomyces sp. NPDC014733 TaxID=3364885 RepID=UPI0036FC1642
MALERDTACLGTGVWWSVSSNDAFRCGGTRCPSNCPRPISHCTGSADSATPPPPMVCPLAQEAVPLLVDASQMT